MVAVMPDPDLLERYGGPAPRYTSYPTALDFGPLDAGRLARALDELADLPLSLYVHLPFCRSVCLFCGCHAVHTRDVRRGDSYLRDLIQEACGWSAAVSPSRPVVQMHWGGGTPTFYPPDALAHLADVLRDLFRFSPEAECAIEADPRVTTVDHLRTLRRAGFNRLSLGVQDTDPAVQRAVNRRQSIEQTRMLIETARALGFSGISVDLICGLPHQTTASFARTLDQIIELRPDRVALFAFAHLPGRIPHQRAIRPADLPSPAERLAMTVQATVALTEAGWHAIGMDHFALPDDPLSKAKAAGTLHRNFQGYTTRGDLALLGLGASAISAAGPVYAQNEKDLHRYSQLLQTTGHAITRGVVLSAEDLLRRHLIMTLMCRLELDWAEADYCPSPAEWQHLETMADDGLIVLDAAGLRVTALGRWFLRAIARVFDHRTTGAASACSRTV